MLSFELKKGGSPNEPDEVEIYCDMEGLDSLIAQLRFLKDGRTEHVHLMSEAWGGVHLDDRPQDPANAPIHHVKILLR